MFHELRLVLVPDYNNGENEINKISTLINKLSPEVRKVLIKMRKHGIREKYASLNEPSPEEISKVQNQFKEAGISVCTI